MAKIDFEALGATKVPGGHLPEGGVKKSPSIDFEALGATKVPGFAGQGDQPQQAPSEGFSMDHRGTGPTPGEGMDWGTVIRQGIKNIPQSGSQFAKDLLTPLLHPVQTVKAVGTLALGAAEKLIPGEQSHEQAVSQLTKVFKDRYGSVENLKTTIAKDPIGAISDVALLFTGVGGIAKGVGVGAAKVGASTVGKVLSQAGKGVAGVGRGLDPLSVIPKAAGKVLGAATPKGGVLSPRSLMGSTLNFPKKISLPKRKQLILRTLDKEIRPTVKGLNQIETSLGELKSKVNTAIDAATASGEKIPLKDILKEAKLLTKEMRLTSEPVKNKRTINRIVNQIDTANREHAAIKSSKAFKNLPIDTRKGMSKAQKKDFFRSRKVELLPTEAQKLKLSIQGEIGGLYEAARTPISRGTKKIIARSVKESLEHIIPEIKGLNKKSSDYIKLRDVITDAIKNRPRTKLSLPIKAGAGGIVAGLPGVTAGIILGILDTPGVRSRLAIIGHRLQKEGKFLSKNSIIRQSMELGGPVTPSTTRAAGVIQRELEGDSGKLTEKKG